MVAWCVLLGIGQRELSALKQRLVRCRPLAPPGQSRRLPVPDQLDPNFIACLEACNQAICMRPRAIRSLQAQTDPMTNSERSSEMKCKQTSHGFHTFVECISKSFGVLRRGAMGAARCAGRSPLSDERQPVERNRTAGSLLRSHVDRLASQTHARRFFSGGRIAHMRSPHPKRRRCDDFR